MRTPRFHQYPHSALGISDKRRSGTVTILGATNACGDSGREAAASAALRFQIAPRPMQFESPASAASTGEVPMRTRITYTSRFFVFPILFYIGYIFYFVV